jgi:Rrf2 family transcriptional regulator, cysteine metabolism repressor
MFKLSKKSDYGLMAINYIDSHEAEGIASTKRIAEEYSIPVELLAKILQRLARSGIIIGQNGPKGGYILSRGLSKISVAEVIQAIEGPIGIVSCYHDESSPCMQISKCTVRSPIKKIQDNIVQYLNSITLDEMNHLMPIKKE